MKKLAFLCLLFCWVCQATAPAQMLDVVRVHGAVSIALPIADAARVLRAERSLEVRIMTSGGSPSGIGSLGDGASDVALSTRPVTQEERAAAPSVVFYETAIGAQAIALVVSKDVWDGGVHALTPEQVRGIYEEQFTNWKQVGGPDLKITVYMSAPGRGMWEMFAQWLYGEARKAPVRMKHAVVNSYDDIRSAVQFTPGSFSQIPCSCVDNKDLFALGIRDQDGNVVQPNAETFIRGTYPLCRKLWMITNDRPTLNAKVLVDFMLSERGQTIMRDASLVPLKEVTPN